MSVFSTAYKDTLAKQAMNGKINKAKALSTTADTTENMDNGYSTNQLKKTYYSTYIKNNSDYLFDFIKRAHGLYQRKDIDIFGRRYRFGLFNPYDALSTTREFLFFTKPDLNIYSRNDTTGALTGEMNEALTNIPYWRELRTKYMDVINCLQLSKDKTNPFNNLLANMCMSNLSVPGLDAETIDTPNNMYGVGYSYRGSSEASNDNSIPVL
jgi:hypothetical protein